VAAIGIRLPAVVPVPRFGIPRRRAVSAPDRRACRRGTPNPL